MQNLCAYNIEVQGKVDENSFNATSPLQVMVGHAYPDTTLFTISADQSGLIGTVKVPASTRVRALIRIPFIISAVFQKENSKKYGK